MRLTATSLLTFKLKAGLLIEKAGLLSWQLRLDF